MNEDRDRKAGRDTGDGEAAAVTRGGGERGSRSEGGTVQHFCSEVQPKEV